MKRLLILFALFILVFAARYVVDYQTGHQTKNILIRFDPEKEKQLQVEVDKGRQPWRLEPVDVAHAALISIIDVKMPFEKCKLSSKINREAIVQCTDVKEYTVKLKQLIRANGIWTATGIQVGE